MRRLLLRRTPRLVAALALACALLAWSVGPAAAHGDLVDGSPGPGDDVEVGSTSVRLAFTALNPGTVPLVAILGPDGDAVAVGAASLADEQTICATSAPLVAGVHTLEYSVLSDDGDRQTGRYTFAVSATGTPADLQDCAGRDLAEPGRAMTLQEMGSGSVPIGVLYGLGGLAVLTAGLVILRVRSDRHGAEPEEPATEG